MQNIQKRVLISFDDVCPFQCKHCYTLDMDNTGQNRTVDEIIDSISEQSFDIVYVSRKRDNFINGDDGLNLCEGVFNKYHCHIFMITRSVLNESQIHRLQVLNEKMKTFKKSLIVAVSVLATTSYCISENPKLVPAPFKRLEFLKVISECGIKTIVLIRPLFPSYIVPIDEIYDLIDTCKSYVSCVVSSGLAVNENILKRLSFKPNMFLYADGHEYLEGAMEGDFRFVNVETELQLIDDYCSKQNVPFFRHSMPAINYINSNY